MLIDAFKLNQLCDVGCLWTQINPNRHTTDHNWFSVSGLVVTKAEPRQPIIISTCQVEFRFSQATFLQHFIGLQGAHIAKKIDYELPQL